MPRALDLDLLNTLVVVADSGSLSAAASRLFRSHSAVGERLRKLEQVCGLSLMVRGKTGASLTPAGERLVVHARQILALSDAALRDLHTAASGTELRFAVTDYFRPRALPGIVERIGAHFPQLRLRVVLRNSALIEAQAHTGIFDIGLSMRVQRDEYSLNVAPGERLTVGYEPMHWVADKTFVLPDGVPLPLIVLPETCPLQRFVIRMLDEHRIAYSIAHSATNIGGLHLALAAGLGVACLNASAIPWTAAPFEHHVALPPLPEVEFSLVPPRCGEPSFVSGVREMLVEHLS